VAFPCGRRGRIDHHSGVFFFGQSIVVTKLDQQ